MNEKHDSLEIIFSPSRRDALFVDVFHSGCVCVKNGTLVQ